MVEPLNDRRRLEPTPYAPITLKGCLGWKDFVNDIVHPFSLYLHTIGEGWGLTGLGLKQTPMQPGRHKRMCFKRFKLMVDAVTRKTVMSAQTPEALQKGACIMALKNQEIDLEVNPHVNGRGSDQEVRVVRRPVTWRVLPCRIRRQRSGSGVC